MREFYTEIIEYEAKLKLAKKQKLKEKRFNAKFLSKKHFKKK